MAENAAPRPRQRVAWCLPNINCATAFGVVFTNAYNFNNVQSPRDCLKDRTSMWDCLQDRTSEWDCLQDRTSIPVPRLRRSHMLLEKIPFQFLDPGGRRMLLAENLLCDRLRGRLHKSIQF